MNRILFKSIFRTFTSFSLVAVLLLSNLASVTTVYAASLTVTKTADTNDGVCNSDCSLREAIATAGVGDTITFDSSLSGQTIYLATADMKSTAPDDLFKILSNTDPTLVVDKEADSKCKLEPLESTPVYEP